MALSLLPQPKSVKMLTGHFDFKEVDTIIISKRASGRTKQTAQLLADEFKRHYHLTFNVQHSANVNDPHGCVITHHTREGVFVKTSQKKPEFYELLAAGHTLTISATDDAGFFAATSTIRELLQDGTRIESIKIEDWPTTLFRAIHLDLKGLTPNLATLKEFIERAARAKYNAVLVEYEDRFPYKCLPDVRGPYALTPETLKEFLGHAAIHGLEIIPLVQTLGHWEFILRHEKYRSFAEVPAQPQMLCPASAGGVKLCKEMVGEILEAHSKSRYIHLGADEAWQLGENPETRQAASKPGGKHHLYIEHVCKFIRQVKNDGKQALIWDDMLREMPLDQIKKLPKGTGLVYWDYHPHNGEYKPELLPALAKYREAGLPVFGASAIKGAEQFYGSVPKYGHRFDNVDWWIEAAEATPLQGHIATSWARFNSNLTPCEPLPVSYPSMLYAAERMWAGLDSSRESFERRLLVGFYGLRPEMLDVAHAHSYITEDRATEAAEIIAQQKKYANRNREVLDLLEQLAWLEVLIHERKRYTEEAGAMLTSLETGKYVADVAWRLKAKVPQYTKRLESVQQNLSALLLKRFHPAEVNEFLQDRLLLCKRMLMQLQDLLRRA